MDTLVYDEVIGKLSDFFRARKFYKVNAQSQPSILAACEDPNTIAVHYVGGVKYPLPQTGQMHLEREILKNPDWQGVYCETTSYRDEKVIENSERHARVFDMFEFESKGDYETLKYLERELLGHLGFQEPVELEYEEACRRYGVSILEAEHEEKIWQDYGSVVFLQHFPQRTHPFWNMLHKSKGIYNKLDVILCGMETIGSAERSVNAQEMRHNFATISNGEYAGKLYQEFGKERVDIELEDYLSLEMIQRYGGGIGLMRLARAMELEGLLDCLKMELAA